MGFRVYGFGVQGLGFARPTLVPKPEAGLGLDGQWDLVSMFIVRITRVSMWVMGLYLYLPSLLIICCFRGSDFGQVGLRITGLL